MNQLPIYWKWEKALPSTICNLLIEEIDSSQANLEASLTLNPDQAYNPKVRKSLSTFLPSNHWFEGVLYNHARYANQSAGWNYTINECERVQFTKYLTDDMYEWHQDSILNSGCEHIRKLSIVCQLNDPAEYVGGGLFIKNMTAPFETVEPGENILLNQGDIVVFPSYYFHKAETIESGERFSAVMWVYGDRWK